MSDMVHRRDVTSAELEVMRALWEAGEAPIRAIADRLYPGGGPSEYATVQKLLDRLRDKGCVSRRPEGRINVFQATVSREDLVARRLRDTAEQLCGGSLSPLLTHLVSAGALSPSEVEELRGLIERLAASDEGGHRR
jgi:BlaI family penicillinase repressor